MHLVHLHGLYIARNWWSRRTASRVVALRVALTLRSPFSQLPTSEERGKALCKQFEFELGRFYKRLFMVSKEVYICEFMRPCTRGYFRGLIYSTKAWNFSQGNSYNDIVRMAEQQRRLIDANRREIEEREARPPRVENAAARLAALRNEVRANKFRLCSRFHLNRNTEFFIFTEKSRLALLSLSLHRSVHCVRDAP